MEKKYTIQPISDLNKIDFSQILQDSKETIRYNFDKSLFIISWVGDTPEFHNTMTNKIIYNKEEINNIVEDWDNDYSSLTGNTIN